MTEGLSADVVRDRDYCPTCQAKGDDECHTPSGRNHRARDLWMIAYDAGRAAEREARNTPGQPRPGVTP